MDRILNKDVTNLIVYSPLIVANFIWCLVTLLIPSRLYMKDVSEDVVLITGAGSGLGRALALEFAKFGSTIVAWDIDASGLAKTRQIVQDVHLSSSSSSSCANGDTRDTCLTYLVDVSDREAVAEAAKQVRTDLNKGGETANARERSVSILVNNAGIYHGLMLHELEDKQIERIFKINVLSHFWTVRTFIDDMIQHRRGHIVEIASMAGISGLQKQVDYCASKFATIGFEDALHMEMVSRGLSSYIKSTVVCPFFFSSNLFTDYKSSLNALMSSDYVAKETVRAIRCNQSMIMLPTRAYINYLLKSLLPRETFVLCTKAMGYFDCVRSIKGSAASDVPL